MHRIFELLNVYILSTANLKYFDHISYMESKKIRREIDSKQTPHLV